MGQFCSTQVVRGSGRTSRVISHRFCLCCSLYSCVLLYLCSNLTLPPLSGRCRPDYRNSIIFCHACICFLWSLRSADERPWGGGGLRETAGSRARVFSNRSSSLLLLRSSSKCDSSFHIVSCFISSSCCMHMDSCSV